MLSYAQKLSYVQKPFTGIDIGYQFGNKQYFETGLNLSMRLRKSVYGELSFGVEDDINSSIIGYKIGFMAYDRFGSTSTYTPDVNPIPILAGISVISYQISGQSVNVLRPEIGIRGIWRHGRGASIAKLTYGYNFMDNEFENQINKHLIRVSFNTNWKSFLDLFGIFID